MRFVSRRCFVAGAAAAAAAAPALGAPEQPGRSGFVDVVVVGAGAAGIAAARRLVAAGRRIALIEATERLGGRCLTDTATFGVPYDRGARWIYSADLNALARLAKQAGLELYPAPPGQRVRIGRRYAREGEMEDFLASLVRANSAISDAARKADSACAQALPKDLGEWRQTVEFVLGPYGCGKDLAEVSSVDLARAADRDNAAFCRQGFGTLLVRLAASLPVVSAAAVTAIDHSSRRGIVVQTTKGLFQAGAVIVTVSTNVLASGKIKFSPDLPKRHLDALGKLRLGSYDRVALELSGNPLGLRADEVVFEKSESRQTAAIFGNIFGSPLCTVDVAGTFGRDLSAKGEAALIEFALSWLASLYGSEIGKQVKRRHATRWNQEAWVLGAASVAAPGAASARRTLMEPLGGRVFFAGEAAHETAWGTVGGAWDSGERAADAVNKLLGGGRGR